MFDLIQEADETSYKAWKLILNKYEISGEKQEILTDVTEEWNYTKLDSAQPDPDDWFSLLFRINVKFGKIKNFYTKDEDVKQNYREMNVQESESYYCYKQWRY